MYFNIVQPLVFKMVTRLHRASFGISSSFDEISHNSWTAWYILFKFYILMYVEHRPATVMQNGDEATPSINLAGRALLMKMLITLELCGIFCSNFVYYCITIKTSALAGGYSKIKEMFEFTQLSLVSS